MASRAIGPAIAAVLCYAFGLTPLLIAGAVIGALPWTLIGRWCWQACAERWHRNQWLFARMEEQKHLDDRAEWLKRNKA